MNENQLETNQKCYIDWEKLNQEFDELRQNEVKVAHEKAVQKVVKKAVQKAVEEVTKETEENVKIKMAKRMKDKGVNEAIISNVTDLSIEEIRELKSGDKNE